MLVRYSDWVRPTDARYAFALRPACGSSAGSFDVAVPPLGCETLAQETARQVLGEEAAERFAKAVTRWTGPEDSDARGERPYARVQDRFTEAPFRSRLTRAQLEPVLAGSSLVMRRGGQVDYVLRDHHMVDVVLHHYRTTGALPTRLLHADRHSDWCSDAFLERRTPVQAATWWKLLEGLKRPADGAPILAERDVHFIWGRARREDGMSGRDLDAPPAVPGYLTEEDHAWTEVLARDDVARCDWVSLDLDFFQPSAQLAVSAPLLRDERFGRLLREAAVRVFCLSPQFTNGGDKIDPWTVQGSLASSLRLLNLLRQG